MNIVVRHPCVLVRAFLASAALSVATSCDDEEPSSDTESSTIGAVSTDPSSTGGDGTSSTSNSSSSAEGSSTSAEGQTSGSTKGDQDGTSTSGVEPVDDCIVFTPVTDFQLQELRDDKREPDYRYTAVGRYSGDEEGYHTMPLDLRVDSSLNDAIGTHDLAADVNADDWLTCETCLWSLQDPAEPTGHYHSQVGTLEIAHGGESGELVLTMAGVELRELPLSPVRPDWEGRCLRIEDGTYIAAVPEAE